MSPVSNMNNSMTVIHSRILPGWLRKKIESNKLGSLIINNNSKGEYKHVTSDEESQETSQQTDNDIDINKQNKTNDSSDNINALNKTEDKSNSLYEIALAWISISLAVLSGSAIGPMFKYMTSKGIRPLLAASWRCQCMVVWLAPLAIIEMFTSKPENKIDWFQYKPGLQFPVFVHVIIAGLVWSGSLLTWIVGLQYTTTVTASLITSMHPLILVFVLYFSGSNVSSLEWLGVLVSIVGIIVASSSSLFELSDNTSRMSLYGDLLCLFAAVNEVLVILNRQKIKKYVPLMQYTTITTLQVALVAGVLSAALEDSNGHIFCMDENCLFGWTSNLWVGPMLIFGLVIGLFCMSGFNYAMQYISPLVFSSVSLLDPAVTGLISWLTGLEGVPDVFVWIGGVTVIAGIGLILVGENKRSDSHTSNNDGSNDNIEMVDSVSKDDIIASDVS